ncbi:unnamed protein product [Brassica oleracea]
MDDGVPPIDRGFKKLQEFIHCLSLDQFKIMKKRL